jgi:hypothetical protein
LGELDWGAVAEGAVGPGGVVLDPPVLDQHLGLEQGIEGLDGEQLVTQPTAEALHVRWPNVFDRPPRILLPRSHRQATEEQPP